MGSKTHTLVIIYGCELKLKMCHTAFAPTNNISVAVQTDKDITYVYDFSGIICSDVPGSSPN